MTAFNATSQQLNGLSELEADRLKHAAGSAVSKAVANGILPRVSTHICERCSEVPAQHYHHESYAREDWLKVVPLCAKCHRQRHKDIKAESDPWVLYTWRELFSIACDLELGTCAWRKSASKAELVEAIEATRAER